MTIAKQIGRNVFSLAAAEGINKLISFLIFAYLARVLGSSGFGQYSFAQAVLAYFLLPVSMGLNLIGSREIARDPQTVPYYVNHIFSIRALVSLISFFLLCVLISFMDKDEAVKQVLFYLGFTIFASAIALDWFFQGVEKMQYIAFTNTLKQILALSLILIWVNSPGHLPRVGIYQSLSTGVAFLWAMAVYIKWNGRPRFVFDWPVWKDLLKQALPIGVAMVLTTLYYNFDTLMLSYMKNDAIVGWYNGAYRIALTLALPAAVVFNAYLPALSRYKQDEQAGLIVNKYIKTQFYLGIPLGFACFLLAPKIILFVFGPQYFHSILPLKFLAWNVLFVYITASFGHPLLAWGLQNQFTKVIALGAVVNLLLNVLLIPEFGMMGAAVATLAGEAAVFTGAYLQFQKQIQVPLLKYALRPLAASLIMSLGIYFSLQKFDNLFLPSLTGMLLYGGTLYFLEFRKTQSS